MSPLTILLFIGLVSASLINKMYYDLRDAEKYFEEFLEEYKKEYSDDEKSKRFEIFKENLNEINRRNVEEAFAVFGIQEFTDLSKEEFKRMYTCSFPDSPKRETCNVITTTPSVQAPEEFDWRDKNVVTTAKNQSHCGSCWTFSVTGNIEGQYALKHGVLQSFSEQQLLDCDKTNYGCSGGYMSSAFRYLQQSGGLETEDDYPYVGEKQTCRFDQGKAFAKVADCNEYHLSSSDEENIKALLYQNGPLSIAILADDIIGYNGGVLLSCSSDGDKVDHAVLLVGYGTDSSKQVPYWLVKNSWGSSWGEEGYFKVKRGGNPCGFINSLMSTAVLT